jgi:hypothetical protein
MPMATEIGNKCEDYPSEKTEENDSSITVSANLNYFSYTNYSKVVPSTFHLFCQTKQP